MRDVGGADRAPGGRSATLERAPGRSGTRTPTRRTQAERVEETRAALLEATIAQLAEVGYAALTTRDVARRAGVSRGAQTHHFPTKADLVVAAVEHVFAEQAARIRDRLASVPTADRHLGTALALLWEVASGPEYLAILELTVAARTDPSLRVVVQAMAVTLEQTVSDLVAELFPDLAADDTACRLVVDLGFSLVQGAAISRSAGFGQPDRALELASWLASLIDTTVLAVMRGALDASS